MFIIQLTESRIFKTKDLVHIHKHRALTSHPKSQTSLFFNFVFLFSVWVKKIQFLYILNQINNTNIYDYKNVVKPRCQYTILFCSFITSHKKIDFSSSLCLTTLSCLFLDWFIEEVCDYISHSTSASYEACPFSLFYNRF